MVPVFSVLGLGACVLMVFRASDGIRENVRHSLAGISWPLPFEMETGYIAVDDLEEVNLFYYFVKSDRNPAEDPLMLWITGGPGCTGLSGLAYEIGKVLSWPPRFDIENYEEGRMPRLVHREESWTRVSSVVFVDSPVGVGFSYSTAAEENEWSDTSATRRLHAFIRKWLVDHPEFISNPFYVCGDSYGGKMAPLVTQAIINGNEAGVKPLINLKGYSAGNPVTTEKRFDDGTKIPYSHGMGLISDELYEETKESCGGDYVNPRNTKCIECLDAVYKNWERLEIQFTLGVYCDLKSPKPKQSAAEDRYLIDLERNHLYSPQIINKECRVTLLCLNINFLAIKSWVDNDAVREALGVRKGSIGEWNRCQKYIKANYGFDVPSSVPYHLNVTSKGFRSLVYSGDHDLEINFMGTQAWIRSFNFSIVDDWRPWLVNGQVAGYTRAYANNLTFATVKGAGHVVTEYKRKETWAMFERWIAGQAL
ncbi:unnamed protein product [Spirodela intermedia]|uniref:Uncharacterized protein n=1 Tax=Spirodela intermedia TaxID=51605 RepID=A0A7I8IIJ3_SPIIN|nr:unnamed protein product [Spirodela intermedia]CAA6657683.1 unnamed protein product [Spirodela intermedia]